MKTRTEPLTVIIAILAGVTASACTADHTPSGLTITVQKHDTTMRCDATLDPPGDPLPDYDGFEMTCGGLQSGPLAGGVDKMRMVIGYGDLTFPDSTNPPAPMISMVLDGQEVSPGGSVVLARRSSPTVFVATFLAPARAVNSMSLAAHVAEGFGRSPVGPYKVDAPEIAVSVQECADKNPCELTAAAGTAAVAVTVPASTATMGEVSWTIDGVRSQQTSTFSLDPAPDFEDTMAGVSFVPVPAVADGASWVVTATVGDRAVEAPAILLHAPHVGAEISGCTPGTPCRLKAGDDEQIVVSAPRGIQFKQATVTSSVDGVASAAPITVDLSADDVAGNIVTGLQTLPVPNKPAAVWVVQVNVGGYLAASVAATIVE